jgi:hypothetical protein
MDAVFVIFSLTWLFLMIVCLAACRAAADGDGVWSGAVE